jgi:hypothetical protein
MLDAKKRERAVVHSRSSMYRSFRTEGCLARRSRSWTRIPAAPKSICWLDRKRLI